MRYSYLTRIVIRALNFLFFLAKTTQIGTTKMKGGIRICIVKAILRLKYDGSFLGSTTTITTCEWSCWITFATASLCCKEWQQAKNSKWKHMSLPGIEPATRGFFARHLPRLVKGQGQIWHSVYKPYGAMQNIDFVRSQPNITDKMSMMRGGTLLSVCQAVKSQDQSRQFVYKTFWAR